MCEITKEELKLECEELLNEALHWRCIMRCFLDQLPVKMEADFPLHPRVFGDICSLSDGFRLQFSYRLVGSTVKMTGRNEHYDKNRPRIASAKRRMVIGALARSALRDILGSQNEFGAEPLNDYANYLFRHDPLVRYQPGRRPVIHFNETGRIYVHQDDLLTSSEDEAEPQPIIRKQSKRAVLVISEDEQEPQMITISASTSTFHQGLQPSCPEPQSSLPEPQFPLEEPQRSSPNLDGFDSDVSISFRRKRRTVNTILSDDSDDDYVPPKRPAELSNGSLPKFEIGKELFRELSKMDITGDPAIQYNVMGPTKRPTGGIRERFERRYPENGVYLKLLDERSQEIFLLLWDDPTDCPYCEETFVKRANTIRHLARSHGIPKALLDFGRLFGRKDSPDSSR